MKYFKLFPKYTLVEWALFILMTASVVGLVVAQHERRTVVGLLVSMVFIGLSVVYDLANSVLVATRHAKGIPTAVDWLRNRTVCEMRLADIALHQQGPVTAALNEILNEPTSPELRVTPAGGTVAGAALVGLLLYSGTANAASQLIPAHPPSASQDTGGGANSSQDGDSHGAESGGPVDSRGQLTKVRVTYDDLCSPSPREPGVGAPSWAAKPLNRLWFAPGLGVGGYLAGCAGPVRHVTGHPDVVYQVGRLDGRIIGLAATIRIGPATMYLGRAATRVLALLRRGEVVVGPNATHIAATQLHLERTDYGWYAAKPD
ncbi:MAG TPA: hypothetical protein VHC43_11830 [Mycobacteriales bacterium]|nr:hypothetical protein [Mycobacteriales bacterium]